MKQKTIIMGKESFWVAFVESGIYIRTSTPEHHFLYKIEGKTEDGQKVILTLKAVNKRRHFKCQADQRNLL